MADAAKVIERVRSYGSNIALDEGGKLRFINPGKLPDAAIEYVREHRDEILSYLKARSGEFKERAAIIEHDGGLTKEAAEALAVLLTENKPKAVPAEDWQWFVGLAAEIFDRNCGR